MRPSPVSLARKIKPIPSSLQVFSQPPSADRILSLPRFVSRAKVEERTSILPAPVPRNHEIKPPTLIEMLAARKLAAGAQWPPNIRIEPVISRATWAPVRKGIRSKLKKMLREE
ncbi:hypothetical protein C8F04DRAFT_35490 [Mycena alexandri]|uniref:Uncharacterized protein n=1 Tax=Mycena alexandri TaxID=1745969 RepID=A0AAD6XB08_9AGAR|nr:hypothetical protein C8F04DRAFT_35490 [Mycena alexandri]